MSTLVVRTGAAGLDEDEPHATTTAAKVARRAARTTLLMLVGVTEQ